jgi:hypothetical protein
MFKDSAKARRHHVPNLTCRAGAASCSGISTERKRCLQKENLLANPRVWISVLALLVPGCSGLGGRDEMRPAPLVVVIGWISRQAAAFEGSTTAS